MLALPFLLLATLELGLRVVGFGRSYPLFVPAPAPGYLLPDAEVARRYFREGTIVPTPQMDFFRAEKRPGAFRIFFQGESSAAGFPYRHGGAPSRMLQTRLQATFPDREMLEHLHPNLEGYFLVSDAFYEALRARRMIGSWSGYVPAARAREELPVSPLDSVAGVFRADRVRSGWPFQPPGRVVTPVVDVILRNG
jgi:hypothetical protein